MSKKRNMPVALTIAGSDSGGGAGIQADLKTFAALGVHGTSVITCVTAQNPRRVLAIEPCRATLVRSQLTAVFEELRPDAIKTGMLFSAPIIGAVARFLKSAGGIQLVVDPVMIATSGRRLLKREALEVLQKKLLPLATLVTPNLAEAAALVNRPVRSVEDMRAAAKEMARRFGCAVLVKGGHLPGGKEAVDILCASDGATEWLLTAPFVKGARTHGTGCTYASAITASLARGWPLAEAVARAKEHITQAIVQARSARGHLILHTNWNGAC